jgi:hypothetical protein
MKVKFILSTLFAAAVLYAQPRIFIEQRTFDFGTVPEGNKGLPHTFSVANKGNEPLKISSVRTSCGCTVAKFDSVIAPGKVGNVSAEFNTSGFTGHQEKVITVYSNDPDSAQIQLRLKTFIKSALDLSQRWMNLYTDNGKVKGSVTLSAAQADLAIKKAQYVLNNNSENVPPIAVKTTIKNKGKPDNDGITAYEFDFEFIRNVSKYENGKIVFDTNVKLKPSIELNVALEPKKDAPY